MSMKGRVILVTGASSGFGKVLAEALMAQGDAVWGASRRISPNVGFHALPMDVTREDSVRSGVAQILSHAGRIDAVINNAGWGIAGAVEDTTDEEAHDQFETNFFGVHRVCRAVIPHMRAAGSGRIINVSSLGGLVSLPFQAFYSASKFAVEGYTEALRMELKAYGIHVSMVEPGDFSTGFTARRRMTAASNASSPYSETATRAIGRMAEDEAKNPDLSPVVRTVMDALNSPSPRLRYPVAGALQRFVVALRPFLPQPLFEYLIMDNYKMR